MLRHHWGELPLIPDTESGIAAIEREQITKPRPLQVEGADLHPPSSHETSSYVLPPEFFNIDPVISHTIALVQHAKKVQSLLELAQSQESKEKASENEHVNIPTAPEIPDFSDFLPLKPMKIGGKLIKTEDSKEAVYSGWKATPKLNLHAARQVLKRSVSVIAAHRGFDGATESVLDVVTDVCHEFFQKLCLHLRYALDREALTGHTAFVDVMEQTLHDSGIGGLAALTEFFKTSILSYHKHMISTCKDLNKEYELIKQPQTSALEDFKTVKVKEEPVSEIQFPSSEDAEDGAGDQEEAQLQLEELQGALQNMESESSSTLKDEDGMKWLPAHQIKKEANNQSLDPDEEIVIVNDSPPPSDVSMSETLASPTDSTKLGRPPPPKKKKK